MIHLYDKKDGKGCLYLDGHNAVKLFGFELVICNVSCDNLNIFEISSRCFGLYVLFLSS
jgi:hypothetical protein